MVRFPICHISILYLFNISDLAHVTTVDTVNHISDHSIVHVEISFRLLRSMKVPKQTFAYTRANIECINYSLAQFLDDYMVTSKM